jgi:hypothetical protein
VSDGLFGTWRLVSAKVEFADTGERADMYGPNPVGRLVLAENHRMVTMLHAAERPANDPAAAFGEMMAYAGTWRVEGEKITTTVDVAWLPDFVGTEQVRFYRLDGDTFHVRTGTVAHPKFPSRPLVAILEWRRER